MSLLYPREILEQLLNERALRLDEAAKKTLFTLVDTVFFASLMLEEGEPVRVAIAYEEGGSAALAGTIGTSQHSWEGEGPPAAWHVTQLSRRGLTARELAKLSRGLKYGTHLVVVGGKHPDLWIDGIARQAPETDGGEVIRIAAPRPGVLVYEEGERELFRFDAGERAPPAIEVLRTDGPVRDAVGVITGDKGSGTIPSSAEWAIEELLRHMRSTRAGGILALSPQAPEPRVFEQIGYRLIDPMLLATRVHEDREKNIAWVSRFIADAGEDLSADELKERELLRAERDAARDALDAAIEDIGELSAIDGAVLSGPKLAVYGAGYIIPGQTDVRPVRARDAAAMKREPLTQSYGARHHAAVAFAQNHPGAVAFVVSEDGPASCITKLGKELVLWPVRIPET